MRLFSLSAAIVAAALVHVPTTAQSSQVSPVTAATVDGSSANAFPWTSTTVRRYQQIHSDLTLNGMLKSMAFRASANTTNYTGTRTVDLEMHMGFSPPYSSISRQFDANYLPQTKQQVLARKIINLGPQGQNTTPVGVFTGTQITFDTPFPYPSTQSLIWEAVVYSNTSSGTFGTIDADGSTVTSTTFTPTGTGCIATGRTAAMAQSAYMQDVGGVLVYGAGVSNAPSSTPVVLAIGGSNPNVVIPGVICGGLYTDLLLAFPVGTSSATGSISNTDGFAFVAPNTLGGLQFYSQQHALDPGLSEVIKIANSNGQTATVPMPNTTKSAKVSRMTNNAGGTTATHGLLFSSTSVGYGLVCRFDL